MSNTAPSRAIIDLNAYAHNLGVIRRFVGAQAHIAAVIKANAYGHGLTPVARKALECKVHTLAVATVDEGLELRAAGIDAPILVTIQVDRAAMAAAVESRLTLMISDRGAAECLGELAHRANHVAKVHCKIDSGMGRQGFSIESAPADLQFVTRISHIDIEGIATHFPAADQPEDTFTYNQIKLFKHLLRQLDKCGIPYELAHAANSAAIVNYHGSIFNMVRPGLMCYGVWPTQSAPQQQLLRPVLRWETRIVQVRLLEPGASVGYGRTYTTRRRMHAAILPVGYADGFKHQLSNRADVLIRGKRCPVRGSVCMDQIVVDISDLPGLNPGETATLIGSDGAETITAAELAQRAETIPYDILAGIGPRVPREYIQ